MSRLYSSELSIPVTRTKPPKNFFNMFLTVGRLWILPERDEQYHRAKSLTNTLEGTGHPGYKHSAAEPILLDMNLYRNGQI